MLPWTVVDIMLYVCFVVVPPGGAQHKNRNSNRDSHTKLAVYINWASAGTSTGHLYDSTRGVGGNRTEL